MMMTGLYQPGEYRDNCGFGLIAHKHGEASHKLLNTAIEALTCMTHRGGIAADGKTGDGCGLLLNRPDAFLRKIAKRDLGTDLGDTYGVGMIFLSQDAGRAAHAREVVEKRLAEEGLRTVGWREVPVDTACLGQMAMDALPRIEQVS